MTLQRFDHQAIREAVARHSGATQHGLQDALYEAICSEARKRDAKPWWDVWNQMALGPSQGTRVTPNKCTACRGRGFSHATMARDMARSGSAACGACRGTRRGTAAFVRMMPLPAALVERYENALNTAGS